MDPKMFEGDYFTFSINGTMRMIPDTVTGRSVHMPVHKAIFAPISCSSHYTFHTDDRY